MLFRLISRHFSRVLLVDGDNIHFKHLDGSLFENGYYREIHIFKNWYGVQQKNWEGYIKIPWERQPISSVSLHILGPSASIKEAVDHTMVFFCGSQHHGWKQDKTHVTILSRDKSFKNVYNLLEERGIPCSIIEKIPEGV